MKRLQAFKFELRPNGEQQRQMRRFAGSCRFVFNKALALQKGRYARGEKKLGYAGLCKELTMWRNGAETPWLADAPIHPLQQTLKDLERAYGIMSCLSAVGISALPAQAVAVQAKGGEDVNVHGVRVDSGGDGAIRTRDPACAECLFSRQVPSASRPHLLEMDGSHGWATWNRTGRASGLLAGGMTRQHRDGPQVAILGTCLA